METIALTKRRKNIDLPPDTLQKLSIMAASKGKSLKAYIENVLIERAASIKIEVSENPSPSGDTWFENQDNITSVLRGIEEIKQRRTKKYTLDEIQAMLGL